MRSSRLSGVTAAALALVAAGAGLFAPASSGRAVPGFSSLASNAHPPAKDTKANSGPQAAKMARLDFRRATDSNNGIWRPSYPQGPGWTVAQVKRMAKKKRNQARNRRAHRG